MNSAQTSLRAPKPRDIQDGKIAFMFNVRIKVTAATLDEAKEIFSAATGAQILENCKDYKIHGC